MNPTKDKSDSSQSRSILLHSISLFLEQNGFSKTLKNFRKEALFQISGVFENAKKSGRNKDDGEICWLDIEAICYEYLKSRKKGTESKENFVKSEGFSDGKKSEQTIENGSVDVQSKKKKKSETADGASKQVIDETEAKPTEIFVEAPLSFPSEHKKKSKNKKKHHEDEPEHLNKDIQEKLSEDATEIVEKKEKKVKKEKKETNEKNESKILEEKATDSAAAALVRTIGVGEEKKESKKRKKPSAVENGDGNVQEAILDDSKRRKTDNSDKSNGIVQSPKTPNGSANGSLEKDLGEKSQKQDKTKELNGSAEPRSAKAAFQRVKPEEVEFADERLQDNSYWAKDGADSGYGAKAQEVLGQVRGRDFRHEKTKKKRGSYRGGLIDLNTHSVKFNYGDEDE